MCAAGEAALKSAQLELQLQSRKQEAEVEMVQAKLQQQAAALVREGGGNSLALLGCSRCHAASTKSAFTGGFEEGLTTLSTR